MAAALSPLDQLKKAARLELTKVVVELSDGSEFIYWKKPLTYAEREKANSSAKKGDDFGFALRLLVDKACFEHGGKMFAPGQIAELKHEVRDSDLQAIMLSVVQDDPEEDLDMKSAGETTTS